MFETDAEALAGLLRQRNNGEVKDTERGYSYCFVNISVGIYRESIPENVAEMIEEAAKYGNSLSSDEIEEERKRANYWATIGIGKGGYYR
ncbi:MAG: hypothetical protein IJY12_02280 [Clostridia bacterium]|nr:hypothetical protein [Clostridia bacterium]